MTYLRLNSYKPQCCIFSIGFGIKEIAFIKELRNEKSNEFQFWSTFVQLLGCISQQIIEIFWTSCLPERVLNNCPCPSVRWSVVRGPSLNISETVHWFFLIFCINFLKKNLGGHQWGKTSIMGYFLFFLSISLHPVIKSF